MKFRYPLRTALCLCALCLLAVLVMSSCGAKLTESFGKIRDEKNNVSYLHASVTYEPVETGKKHGSMKISDRVSLDVYRIEGLDPKEWLATEDGNVLYASTVKLPTLAQMKPVAVQICSQDASIHVLRQVDTAETVAALVDAWDPAHTLVNPGLTPQRSYKLRFVSEDYPSLYYCVTYVEYASDVEIEGVNYGKYFLYSAFDKVFVPAGDRIHRLITVGTEAETTT